MRETRYLRALLVVGVVLVLVVIGAATWGGGDNPAATTAPTSATTVRQATVRQLASIVSEQEPKIRSAIAGIRVCGLTYERCDLTGKLSFSTLNALAQTLRLRLDAADDPRPDNQLFIGAYPAEIDHLTKETITAAALVAADTTPFGSGGPCAGQRESADCMGAALRSYVSAGQLVSQLDAWRPYL